MAQDDKPITIDGEIETIDFENRYFTLRDRQGRITHKVFWFPRHESYMKKQKAGYYEKMIIEPGTSPDARLVDITYCDRPADWPKRSRSGGAARDDRIITYQTCYKETCETARHSLLHTDELFSQEECDSVMDWALARAKKDAKDLIEAARGA